MVREVSLVGQTPSSAPDPLVRLFHDPQDRPTRASAADQGVCPTMRIYSMNYGDRRLGRRGDTLQFAGVTPLKDSEANVGSIRLWLPMADLAEHEIFAAQDSIYVPNSRLAVR